MRRRPHPSNDRLDRFVTQLAPLLQAGEATRGLHVDQRRGAIVLSGTWVDDVSGQEQPDPRFRLTPLGGVQFGLSLWRGARWERLPFEGSLTDLVDVINTVLPHWAGDF